MAISRTCQYCSERFTTDQHKRVFCSDKCKTRYHRLHRLTCWYCGELATSIDHLFPQVIGGGKGDTVPACLECNKTVQHMHAGSVAARCKFLFYAYVKKFKLNKFIPEWDDDEIEELTGSLKKTVKHKIMQRQRAIERVEYIRSRFMSLEETTLPYQSSPVTDDDDDSFFVSKKKR